MGYVRVEKFDNLVEWSLESGIHTYFKLDYTDWPHLISSPDKAAALRLTYDKTQAFTGETYFFKQFNTPIKFVVTDYYDKPVEYPDLILTMLAHPNFVPLRRFPVRPEQFYLSMSIWDGPQFLREWYVVLNPGPSQFHGQCFDLRPLIDQGYTQFDRIQFNILQNGGDLKLYFGDLYIIQDEVEHNLASTVQDKLHLKMRKKLTKLAEPVQAGDKEARLLDLVDVYENIAIIIGDPNGLHELHVLASAAYEDPENGGTGKITLTGEFDTEQFQQSWPAGTDVWFVVPATMGDLSQSEAIFPVFYISWEAPTPRAEWTPDFGRHLDSYTRDRLNGQDTVGVRLAPDTTRIVMQVHVYAPVLEIAVDMWRFLRSIFDEQNFIDICGIPVDYDVIDFRKLDPGADVISVTPHYIMEMECYPTENVHTRIYRPFPAIDLQATIYSNRP